MNRLRWVIILCVMTGAMGCGSGSGTPERRLTGAGSTFVYPLMLKWSAEYEKTEAGCKVSYEETGSGRGIKAILEKRVDFACSDAPLTDEQLLQAREKGGELLHIPLVLGAVAPVYNLAELTEPLRFSGPVLAEIYLGKITKWNDAALKSLNPQVANRLPDRDIAVVHRSDGSGTTYIWVDYLSKVSSQWKTKIGTRTEVPWPTGQAAFGNEGVAKQVRQTPGSIGYVELSNVYRFDLQAGLVQNREQEFVKATLQSVTQAAKNGLVHIPDDLRFSITDAPGNGSYPISGTTWALVRNQQFRSKGHELQDFLSWAIDLGQEHVDQLFYVKLPESLLDRAREKLKEIQMRD